VRPRAAGRPGGGGPGVVGPAPAGRYFAWDPDGLTDPLLRLGYYYPGETMDDYATYRLAGTHGPFAMSGNTGNPRSRIQWSHTLAREDWSLPANLHHNRSFRLTHPR